jgi:hypothetical protein
LGVMKPLYPRPEGADPQVVGMACPFAARRLTLP